MTIIFNFFSLGASIISLICSVRFYYAYKRSKTETIKNCSLAFLFIFFALFTLAFPQLILFEPVWIQIDLVLVDIFLLGTVLCFNLVLLELAKLSHYKKTSFLVLFFWMWIYIFLNIIFFSPAKPLISEGRIYYWISGALWLQNITRGLLILGSLMTAIFVFKKGKELKEKTLFLRSVLIGIAILLIVICGVILWFFPIFYFSPFLLILGGFLGFLAFLIGFFGVLIILRPNQDKLLQK